MFDSAKQPPRRGLQTEAKVFDQKDDVKRIRLGEALDFDWGRVVPKGRRRTEKRFVPTEEASMASFTTRRCVVPVVFALALAFAGTAAAEVNEGLARHARRPETTCRRSLST